MSPKACSNVLTVMVEVVKVGQIPYSAVGVT